MSGYSAEHMERLRTAAARMVAEVPLYRGYGEPPREGGPARLDAWLQSLPAVGKKELRRGFPKSLVRSTQDLAAAMHEGRVTLLATSGTTGDRLHVLWEWTWWDPQEREAMRLNARAARALSRPAFREAVLSTPACGGGVCHLGSQSLAERTIDGMLFFNQSPDPSYWTEAETERMLREWRDFSPTAVEADPAYLARLCRAARRRGLSLPAPEVVALTYETTTRAQRRDIARTLDAPLFQLYGATEAGVLLMECEHSLLHANERHAHLEFAPLEAPGGPPASNSANSANSSNSDGSASPRLARVLVTTIDREWMPLLRYDIGDAVRLSPLEECPCGRPARGPLVERVEGRVSDCVKVGERVVTPLMLDDAIFAAAPEHLQWQLSGDALLVVGSAEDANCAAAAASSLLEESVRGESVQAIAPEASGKYRLVRA